jgi:hypothetical protein
VLGLAGAVIFLLSQLNARTYRLTVSDGRLVVEKGLLLPLGSQPYHPADAAIAEAYAPLDLHGHSPGGLTEETFNERDELDRALFSLMEGIARPLVSSQRVEDLDAGLALLQRMQKLPGITPEQREGLKKLEAEVAFDQGRMLLVTAQRSLGQALSQLKLAAESGAHNASAAQRVLSTVQGPSDALKEAIEAANQSAQAKP